MKPRSLFLLGGLALVLTGAAWAQSATSDVKKLTDRYALTRKRIDALLALRKAPSPLPTTALPNPFYIPAGPAAGGPEAVSPEALPSEEVTLPTAADESDADTLARLTAGLRLAGYIQLNGQPHITINGAISKVGDVVTLGNKDKPTYIHVVAITPQDLTLRLNEATLTVPIRK